jgi:SAC3 family protein LENG8/THP3
MSTSLSSGRTHETVPGKKRKKVTKHANFVGTSAVLEKAYLRLTDYPKPENVRPLPILIKALAHIKSHYIRNEDFEWANEQLKSVRQDLMVQNIQNNFSLNVYETHARILIEHGELDEFHQCQCMIQVLTSPTRLLDSSSEGTDELGGDFQLGRNREGEEGVKQSEEAVDEFYAYGLLYHLAQKSWGELTRLLATLHRANGENDSDSPISSLHFEDIPSHSSGVSVRHALKVVVAVMHVDYYKFFRLYESAPHLSAYLMDFLVRRVRKDSFERIIASYRPSLSVEHFRLALSFEDLEETRQFLKENGAMFIHELGAPPFWVDCKATAQAIPRPISSDGRILS